MSATKISYPQPHDGQGQLHLFGDKHAKKIIFMCAGYPDDHSAFTPLAERCASSPDECLVGVACLPGFEGAADRSLADLPKDGYTVADWVSSIREAIKALRKASANKDAQLIAVYHDWSVLPGLQITNQTIEEESPDLKPSKLIIFDIMTRAHPKTPNTQNRRATDPRSKLQKSLDGVRLLIYPSMLAMSFYVQKYLPAFLATLYLQMVYLAFDLFRIFPIGPGDMEYLRNQWFSREELPRVAYKGYPYKLFLSSMMAGRVKDIFKGATLPRDLNQTPTLFLYGAAKRFPLHPVQVEALLEDDSNKSRCVRVENAGHWLYRTHLDLCFQEIAKFISE